MVPAMAMEAVEPPAVMAEAVMVASTPVVAVRVMTATMVTAPVAQAVAAMVAAIFGVMVGAGGQDGHDGHKSHGAGAAKELPPRSGVGHQPCSSDGPVKSPRSRRARQSFQVGPTGSAIDARSTRRVHM